jgi:hypothetical protein
MKPGALRDPLSLRKLVTNVSRAEWPKKIPTKKYVPVHITYGTDRSTVQVGHLRTALRP